MNIGIGNLIIFGAALMLAWRLGAIASLADAPAGSPVEMSAVMWTGLIGLGLLMWGTIK